MPAVPDPSEEPRRTAVTVNVSTSTSVSCVLVLLESMTSPVCSPLTSTTLKGDVKLYSITVPVPEPFVMNTFVPSWLKVIPLGSLAFVFTEAFPL